MKATMSVRQLSDLTANIRKAVATLTSQDVYIGVPAEKTEPRKSGEPVSNADLSYIHEFGAPGAGIPARPHLVPGVEDIKSEAVGLLKGAAQKALDGNEGAVEAALNKIGLLGQNAVRARFVKNNWEPLSDATLNTKALKKDDTGAVMLNKKGEAKRSKSRAEQEKTNPLIVTDQLRKSHTYVVRKRGAGLITPDGGK